MMQVLNKLRSGWKAFAKEEDGNMTVDFAITIPTAFLFASATFEGGMVGLRDMMLEHAVDVVVRDVRTGRIPTPTHATLMVEICNAALIVPDCLNQLKLEMVRSNPRAFTAMSQNPDCIDRTDEGDPVINFTSGGNNELMILRACALFDPIFPTATLGAAIPKKSEGAYALVATSTFVVEPFQ